MLSPIETIQIFQRQSDLQSFTTGQLIFEEKAPANCMYGIVEGEVEILLDGNVVETLKPGEVFGVGAIINEGRRRHGAIAKTDCKLASLDESRFLFAVQETPMFALAVMKSYSNRLDNLVHMLQRAIA